MCRGRVKKKEMANQNSGEGSSSCNVPVESTESTVQLNIKTLESQAYSVQADKNMLVLSFKEKIADEVGVPVGQQRLIFRGKVLKDEHPLSEYHVENGDTLHLVTRQPAQSQDSSGPTSAGNENPQGNDPSGGAPRNRIGQISHSVVLGTFNGGDQGEGDSADISRVIGAVLNSMGIGNQAMGNGTGGMQSANMSNNPGTSPLGNGSEGNVGGPSPTQVGSQAQPGQAFPIQSFQSLPQLMQIPLAGSGMPLPTLNTPIPSSLTTISEFMNRMEQALSQNGDSLNTSSNSDEERPRVNLHSTEQGLHTPEALSIVLRQAERLLSNQAVASLSHIARGLEQETLYTSLNTRGQIHGEAMRLGLNVQHLGALLLELGRTIMTLQLGNSRVQSGVNSGPAVYISPSGPNPIMVQPFPLQASSISSGSIPPLNPLNFGQVGVGAGHRNVNIHIHAGTSLGPMVAQVGTRPGTGDGRQGERNSRTGSADSRSSGIAMSNAPQPASGASDSNPVSLPHLVSEINSRVRSLIGNMQGDNPLHSGQAESNAVQNASASSISRDAENDNDSTISRTVHGDGESSVSLPRSVPQQEGCEPARGVSGSEGDLTESVKDSDRSVTSQKKENVGETAPGSSKKNYSNEVAKAVPLGLGFGGLECKRQAKPQQSPAQSCESGTTSITQNHQSRSNEQVRQSGLQGSDGEADMASMMSQVLQSPALNGLLSGVSQQTGVGSPDALRNMLQQFTQSPQMRNVVNQIAQQVDTDEVESMFGDTGGQAGGLDISRMFQQMMPIVSRALGGGGSDSGPQRPVTQSPQSLPSVQSLAGTIEDMNAPEDIFRTLVENSVGESGPVEVVDELCSDEDLVNEYIGLLQNEMHQRFQDESER